MARDWSALPVDLLFDIAMKLENIDDFIYFSAVCRVWRDISSQIKHQWRGIPVPWLFLAENKKRNPNCLRKIYNLSNNKCYHLNLPETFGRRCWGTPYGWIVMIERDLNVRLFNPITKAQICFPSSESIPTGDRDINKLSDEKDLDWYLGYFFKKVIMFKVSQCDLDQFVIVALTRRCLAFARQGDQSWTTLLRSDRMAVLLDIVGVGDKVFALYSDGTIAYWNVTDLREGKVVKQMNFAPSNSTVKDIIRYYNKRFISSEYLVHLNGEFIMVLRKKREVLNEDGTIDFNIGYITLGFVILRLDSKEKTWQQMEDLGGVTLFIGGNAAMTISSTLSKSLQQDCIYFTDDRLLKENGGHDMGAYDMKSKKFRSFYDGGDVRTPFCPPTWFIPQF